MSDSTPASPGNSAPPAPQQVRVALVDDHAMVREALSSVLSDDPDIEIVAHGGDRAEAVRIAKELRPDVLILDYNMPGGGALEVLGDLERADLDVSTLVLTVHTSPQYAVRVLEAGAHGFLFKSSALDELLGAIREVHSGGIYITPSIARQVLEQMRRPRRSREGLAALSTRELELLRILSSGQGIKQAALALGITVSTASTYRARLQKKLGLSSVSDLIRFALENDLVE